MKMKMKMKSLTALFLSAVVLQLFIGLIKIEAAEIGFVSYNADDPDFFQFVALAEIAANEVIFFTDNGVTSDGGFRANEGTIEWTAPATPVPIGTVIQVSTESTTVGSVVNLGNLLLSSSGDQLTAYQGSEEAPIFIAALNNNDNGVFQADATSSNTGALPPGLVLGTTAVAFNETDNFVYDGPTEGDIATVRALLFDQENFILNNDVQMEFTGSFSLLTGPTASPLITPGPTAAPFAPTTGPTSPPFPSGATTCVGYPEAPPHTSSHYIGEVNQIAFSLANSESADASVTVEGVIVADLTDTDFEGFYLQAPANHIALEGFSEAIFVNCGEDSLLCAAADIQEGDYVKVTGTPINLFSAARLDVSSADDIEVLCGFGINPSANIFCPALCYGVNIVDLSFPLVSASDLNDGFVGMLVNIQNEMTVTNLFDLRFGTLHLSAVGRLPQPTMIAEPGSVQFEISSELNDLARIPLDDFDLGSCPNEQLYFDPADKVRVGFSLREEVLDATTVLFFFGAVGDYRLLPTVHGSEVIPQNYQDSGNSQEANLDIPLRVNEVFGDIRVASVNMLNYFILLVDDDDCGNCRGADNAFEFSRQAEKLYASLIEQDAAVYGLQEIQNLDEGDDALTRLVDDLNAIAGEEKFAFISTGKIETDAIKNGIIYQPAYVVPVGEPSIFVYSDDSTGTPKSRPSLLQEFKVAGCDFKFRLVVNHLKSKGSACEEDEEAGTPNVLEGEGNCGFTRLTHANELIVELDRLAALDASPVAFILVGDFNSYAQERSIKALQAAGFVDLVGERVPSNERYTTTFDGEFGTLDYVFISSAFADVCGNAFEWHINSDEAAISDYNDRIRDFCDPKPLNFVDDTFFRSSDHDPVLANCFVTCEASGVHLGFVGFDAEVDSIEMVFLAEAPASTVLSFSFLLDDDSEVTGTVTLANTVTAGSTFSLFSDPVVTSIGTAVFDSDFSLSEVEVIVIEGVAMVSFESETDFSNKTSGALVDGSFAIGRDALFLSSPLAPEPGPNYVGPVSSTFQSLKLSLFSAESYSNVETGSLTFTLQEVTPTENPTLAPTGIPTMSPVISISGPTDEFTFFPTVSPVTTIPTPFPTAVPTVGPTEVSEAVDDSDSEEDDDESGPGAIIGLVVLSFVAIALVCVLLLQYSKVSVPPPEKKPEPEVEGTANPAFQNA